MAIVNYYEPMGGTAKKKQQQSTTSNKSTLSASKANAAAKKVDNLVVGNLNQAEQDYKAQNPSANTVVWQNPSAPVATPTPVVVPTTPTPTVPTVQKEVVKEPVYTAPVATPTPVPTYTPTPTPAPEPLIAPEFVAPTYNAPTLGTFNFDPYKESQAVLDARDAMNAHNANGMEAWTGGQYGQALQSAIDRIVNRENFSYDMNADALYQQYKDRYIGLGKMAMQDTLGQAQGATGGYGNSYAATAANQAYQGYLQGINDKLPELYQLAYNKYSQEGQNLLDQYNMYNSQYNTEYGQYRDKVSDWYNEAERLNSAYNQAYAQDYGKYSDDYQRNYQQFSDDYNRQYQQNMDSYQAAYQKALDEYQSKYQGYTFEKNYALDTAKFEADKQAQAQQLALNWAKYNSDQEMSQKQFAADQAYRANNLALEKQKLSQTNGDLVKPYEAQITALQNELASKGGQYTMDQLKTAEVAMQRYNSSLMTPTEFARHKDSSSGSSTVGKYKNYEEYYEDQVEKLYNSKKIDDTTAEIMLWQMKYGK